MDIRLFKLLIIVSGEILLVLLYYLEPILFTPFMIHHHSIPVAIKLIMIEFPFLILLPESTWIWLVEESPRGRKISLRSKATKHLYLSTIYVFGIFHLFLPLCVALMMVHDFYTFDLTYEFITAAVCYGMFCAWKNYSNIMKYESLFALGWDCRAHFYEIFVGMKVSRRAYFFYSGFALLCGLILMVGSFVGPYAYYKFVKPPNVYFDIEKHIVMSMVFHFFLVASVWATTLFVTFSLFFSGRLEHWAKQSKDRRTNRTKVMKEEDE